MKTKLEQMKECWASGDTKGALRFAAGWPRLGEHKVAIQQAWQATQSPDFYKELGKDPEDLIQKGLKALQERYDLPSLTDTH